MPRYAKWNRKESKIVGIKQKHIRDPLTVCIFLSVSTIQVNLLSVLFLNEYIYHITQLAYIITNVKNIFKPCFVCHFCNYKVIMEGVTYRKCGTTEFLLYLVNVGFEIMLVWQKGVLYFVMQLWI